MKIIGSILGALLASTAAISVSQASTLNEVISSSYKLYQGSRGICSSVAISPTQLVTAAHCIARNASSRDLAVVVQNEIDYEVVSEYRYNVKAIRVNYDDDTAFLELMDPEKTFPDYVDVAEKFNPEMGDMMYAIGYPRLDVITLTEGMFTGRVFLNDARNGLKGEYNKSTVPVTGGSSGGGVYVKEWDPVNREWEYSLVGLTTAGYRDVDFQNYFSTLENVQKVMKGLVKNGDE